MLFCGTFQIQSEAKSDSKPPETTVTPTHTHPHTPATAQLNVPLIFSSFNQHKHPDMKTETITWLEETIFKLFYVVFSFSSFSFHETLCSCF